MICIKNFDNLRVLGVNVHLIKTEQVIDIIEEWVSKRYGCNYIIATGMHGVMEARRDPKFKTIIDESTLFVPDGFSLVFVARLKGFRIMERVSGPDLMLETCKRAAVAGHSVFFYGDTIETLEMLSERLIRDLPDLKIAGTYSPPFRALTPEEDAAAVDLINSSNADILWVGLGLPKQEQWMYEHKHKLDVPAVVGVGAAFKFLSGRVRRAPKWMGDNGFEWLWRLIFEPRRVWRRVLLDGPKFVFLVAKETLDSRRRPNTK